MADRPKLGRKIRRLRLEGGLTQVQLARRLGISASYLNLIEHDQRALTVALLLKLAELFDVDVHAFSVDEEARLATELSEVFGDVLFAGRSLGADDAAELARASPEGAKAVLALYRAYRDGRDANLALAARVTDDDDLVGLGSARSPSEEVSDFIQEALNYFEDLETAAEALWRSADLEPDGLERGLVRHLADAHGVKVEVVSYPTEGGPVRRYDPETRQLQLSEVLAPRTRAFQLAHQVGLLEARSAMDARLAQGRFSGQGSRVLGRVAMANYFAGAVLMPYTAFAQAARSVRYDIEALGHRFRTSFEQVCHRLSTLQRPGDQGVPFHFVRVDIAGNLSKRFSASGISFARYSGACPRWSVHAAFLTPGFIRTQLSRMPDGTAFFDVARTVRKEGGSYTVAQSRYAISLGCETSYARNLVYADGVDLDNLEAAVPIGVSCRLCERTDCTQRAFPPLHQRLDIDENVRNQSFYVSTRRS